MTFKNCNFQSYKHCTTKIPVLHVVVTIGLIWDCLGNHSHFVFKFNPNSIRSCSVQSDVC